ncbi:MAG: polysaccharide deacetylase family protein [Proteobacteria bacterium]|nr:MAG: polysaccharide deacetylase family protein [Pseudomonadota bacterium]
MTKVKVPVLTYHAANITGNSYQSNDRIAFQSDLYNLHHLGFQIIPLYWLAEWVNGDRELHHDAAPYVALSCDDGLDHDFIDGDYLNFGPQKSFYRILKDFHADVGQKHQPHAHLTAFVIACSRARTKIAMKSLQGHQLLNDNWWKEANHSALMAIENHSWDHRHPDIYCTEQANFKSITDETQATRQIIRAKKEIDRISAGNSQLFCYPWGHHNTYLAQEFLPTLGQQAGIKAAFTCEAKPVTHDTNPWLMPRYVCGPDWHSPNQLIQLLKQDVLTA